MKNLDDLMKQTYTLCYNQDEEISNILSPYSELTTNHLLPLIFLLPIEKVKNQHLELAAAFLFLQYSRNFHEKVEEENTPFNSEAVLYGDLFYSLSYTMLEANNKQNILTKIAEIMVQYNEAWFYLNDFKNTKSVAVDEIHKVFYNDLGNILELAAFEGGKAAGWAENSIEKYKTCALEIAILRDSKKYNMPLDFNEKKEQIIVIGEEIDLKEEMAELCKLI